MNFFKRLLTTATLSAAASTAGSAVSDSAYAAPATEVRVVEVLVDGGYKPNRIEIREGQRLVLKFTRRDTGPCSSEVVFPALGIRSGLPAGQVITIELPALKAGSYEFKCGMDMLKGTILVRPSS